MIFVLMNPGYEGEIIGVYVSLAALEQDLRHLLGQRCYPENENEGLGYAVLQFVPDIDNFGRFVKTDFERRV